MCLIEIVSDVLLQCPVEGERRIMPKDTTAESILDRLSDLENYPEETLVPYKEFEIGRKLTISPRAGSSTGRIPGPRRLGASSAAFSPMRLGAIGLPPPTALVIEVEPADGNRSDRRNLVHHVR